MGARSRNKGSRAEREVCRLFQQHLGGTWSRVPLSGGWGNRRDFETCGDVITTLPDFPFTIECKNAEGWHLEHLLTHPDTCLIARWWQQTCAEATEAGKKPMLVFTRNFQPLYVAVRSEDCALAGSGVHLALADQGIAILMLEQLLPALASRVQVQAASVGACPTHNDGESSRARKRRRTGQLSPIERDPSTQQIRAPLITPIPRKSQ